MNNLASKRSIHTPEQCEEIIHESDLSGMRSRRALSELRSHQSTLRKLL